MKDQHQNDIEALIERCPQHRIDAAYQAIATAYEEGDADAATIAVLAAAAGDPALREAIVEVFAKKHAAEFVRNTFARLQRIAAEPLMLEQRAGCIAVMAGERLVAAYDDVREAGCGLLEHFVDALARARPLASDAISGNPTKLEEAILDRIDALSSRVVVTLCGSTRFYEHFRRATYEETIAGRVVLSVGFFVGEDAHGELVGCTPEQKQALDLLHFDKIAMSDEVLVLNVDGYIGDSTANELALAIGLRKRVRWLDQGRGERWVDEHRDEIAERIAAHRRAGRVHA